LPDSGNVDDRNLKHLKCLQRNCSENCSATKIYFSFAFKTLFDSGVHLVTGIKSNMKNRLTNMHNQIVLRKHSVIETINDQLKNICETEHSRHRPPHNFLMNQVAALAAYAFFDKKPALKFNTVPTHGQLALYQ
jgi:hypothetical protein